MPNPVEDKIKERIQSFISELDLLVRKSTLEALRGVLEGVRAPARRGRPPGRRGPGRPPAGGGSDGLASQIRAHVSSNPGQSVGEIVSAVGGNAAAVKRTIKAMLGAGEIRKTGEKRGTRYFPSGPGRLPGASTKRAKGGKRRVARRTARKTRKTRRRASPRKKARQASRGRSAAGSRRAAVKVLVPARKARRPVKQSPPVPEVPQGKEVATASAS